MNTWHTCGTTHCRAGWAVHLAGEPGYELEKIGGTCFAAMMIFKYSSDIKVSPVRFFEDNETAYRDIKKCAAAEKSKNKKDKPTQQQLKNGMAFDGCIFGH